MDCRVPAMRGALRGVLAVAITLSLLAATGCGNDTKPKNDYVAAVNKAQADFVAVVDDTQARLAQNTQDSETATSLDGIRTAAAGAVQELRAVKPPSGVGPLHAKLIREAQGLVVAFRKAADAYRSGTSARILKAKVDLKNDVARVNTQINATIQELNSKLRG
ncbi:MAG: hypothetical protein QOH62_2446 [Solirubrobacteraceae bacterium]|nr:hypothetical protein [Solirubrobacteraceae bacterium]